MKKVLFTFFFPAFLFVTCQNESGNNGDTTEQSSNSAEQQKEQKAWDEMMVIHDDVMPKMSAINAAARDLKDWGTANRETMANGDLERISVALTNLSVADDGMMNWMNGLKQLDKLRAESDHAAIMRYLDTQTQIIAKVKDQMLSSIEEGNKLLVELKGE